jgi:hypothetical protein
VSHRFRSAPIVLLAVALTGLAQAGCGGGGHSYKAGTPAATGQAPDCSVVPVEVVKEALKRDVLPAIGEPRGAGGVTCTFNQAKGAGAGAAEQVQLNSDASKETMERLKAPLEQAHNPVKTIKGWGDQAFAWTVYYYSNINNFAVRKGKVSVTIVSTAGYDDIKKLMKAVLAKL